jgi:hypothetical protein
MTNRRLEPEVGRAATERAILAKVKESRAAWFPELSEGPARLRPISIRPRALLYAVHLDDSDVPQLLAKVRRDSDPASGVPASTPTERPRLRTDVATAAELTRFEYQGLRGIRTLTDEDDPRFDAIRPLAELPEHSTILMDFHHAPTLHRALLDRSRFSRFRHPLSSRLDVPMAWSRAGAWLRRFHDGMPADGLAVRQRTREDVCDRFRAYASYFADVRGIRAAAEVARQGEALAAATLPDVLSLAVGHGDYAPRNLFVEQTGRIAVIDPMPRWVVPRHEDIGRFLIALRLLGLQLHSHGAAFSQDWLAEREREFLTGYYGDDPVPTDLVRCYQVLILVDKWSALVDRSGSGRARLEAAGVRMARGYITRQARRLLEPAPS